MRYIFKSDFFFFFCLCLWSSMCKGTSHEWAAMAQVVRCFWRIALTVKWIILQAVHTLVTELRGQLWKRSPRSRSKSGKSENIGFSDPRTATGNRVKWRLSIQSSRSVDWVVGVIRETFLFRVVLCGVRVRSSVSAQVALVAVAEEWNVVMQEKASIEHGRVSWMRVAEGVVDPSVRILQVPPHCCPPSSFVHSDLNFPVLFLVVNCSFFFFLFVQSWLHSIDDSLNASPFCANVRAFVHSLFLIG